MALLLLRACFQGPGGVRRKPSSCKMLKQCTTAGCPVKSTPTYSSICLDLCTIRCTGVDLIELGCDGICSLNLSTAGVLALLLQTCLIEFALVELMRWHYGSTIALPWGRSSRSQEVAPLPRDSLHTCKLSCGLMWLDVA